MTVGELQDQLARLVRAGKITPDDTIEVRNPSVSEEAVEAGSNGYHEADEVLVPGDGRVVLLGEVDY